MAQPFQFLLPFTKARQFQLARRVSTWGIDGSVGAPLKTVASHAQKFWRSAAPIPAAFKTEREARANSRG